MSENSVSLWLTQLREGDSVAARDLWQRYFSRVVSLAREKLRGSPQRTFDEEDVAVDVFDSIYRGIKAGRYPNLEDREDLWRMLFVLTMNKSVDRQRRELSQRRGGGKVRGGSAFGDLPPEHQYDQHPDDEPTPEIAALMIEQMNDLINRLDSDELRTIALLKMEGYTDEEIARKTDRVRRTVVRKLRIIRAIWDEHEAA